VTVPHWVDEFFHFEARIQITLGPMELDVSIGQKVDLARISPVVTISANDGVLCISNSSELKQSLVELGQPWEVVRANVHVVKLECHSAFFR
jgi:hypothetical protein